MRLINIISLIVLSLGYCFYIGGIVYAKHKGEELGIDELISLAYYSSIFWVSLSTISLILFLFIKIKTKEIKFINIKLLIAVFPIIIGALSWL